METFTLRTAPMQLWLLPTECEGDSPQAYEVTEALTAEDLIEAKRFLPEKRRRQFLGGRALLRRALAARFPISGSAWRVDRDSHGRPYLRAPEVGIPVHFSISHTRGLTACLVAQSRDVAVDVEWISEEDDLRLVARESFAPMEAMDLDRREGWDWFARFYDYWTLKEAYCKARGLGLSLRLADIELEITHAGGIRMHRCPEETGDPASWGFWNRHVSHRHVISIAAGSELHAEPQVTWWHTRSQGGAARRGNSPEWELSRWNGDSMAGPAAH